MTQEFFVDAGAVGTGSGDTPTDAFDIVGHFTNASSLPSSFDFGSRVWIRKTHEEDLYLTALGGYNARLFIGPNGQVVQMQNYGARVHFIGWPNSGDPWYNNRPAAGISAGWDSDVSSSVLAGSYGWNAPVLVNSHLDINDAFIPDHRVSVYNVAFRMANRSSITIHNPIYFQDDINQSAIFDNIYIEAGQYWDMGVVYSQMRKLTTVASYGGLNGPIFQVPINARHLIIHSLSLNQKGIFGDQMWVGKCETWSNSVAYIAARDAAGGQTIPYLRTGYLGSISGIEPHSSSITHIVYHNNIANENLKVYCGDYFGQGPAVSNGRGSRDTFMVTSAQAMYDADRVMGMDVGSMNVLDSRQNGEHYDDEPIFVRHLSVVSGQLYDVVFPFYQVHSVGDWAEPALEVDIPFIGGGNFPLIGSGYVTAGSLSNWSGTYVTGGSAWQGEFSFVAGETREGDARFFGSPPIAVSTNAYTEEIRLFGVPTVNSA